MNVEIGGRLNGRVEASAVFAIVFLKTLILGCQCVMLVADATVN